MKTLQFCVFAIIVITVLLNLTCTNQQASSNTVEQNWTHYVRIGGHGLSLERVDSIIKDAQQSNMFGIETDNDIPGRYESFLDPTQKLQAIKAIAEKAHAINNYAFVYIAGLECITANADQSEHSFFKDHPDWVQRKITGEPAIFGGGTAFWITEGDEDVWISPFPQEWRTVYMERVRQIAATGIDGIYVDIPYWMTHFRGWEDSWASFDDYTVAAFKKETGLNAKTDLKLGDFNDPNFRKWVDFRIKTLTEFMADIDKNAKSVNPKCMTIAEIYPGYGEDAVRVGADVYDMYPAVDVIAHEYSAGGYTAVSRNPKDWFNYMIGMYTFRAFAEGKASWMLSYSWDNQKNLGPQESMKNLALSQVMAGTNFWDARGHVMSGSNDYPTRIEIFNWIAANEKTLYLPRTPINPVGVYFSPKTRDYFTDEFFASYTGFMLMLLQSHLEFQIVTPRILQDFHGKVLILSDVKCVSESELSAWKKYLNSGGKLWITAEGGSYTEDGSKRTQNAVHSLFTLGEEQWQQPRLAGEGFLYQVDCPGKAYFKEMRTGFDQSAWNGNSEGAEFVNLLDSFKNTLSQQFSYEGSVKISASPFISAQIATVNGQPHVFIANFKGLKGRENDKQLPEKNVNITFPAEQNARIYFLDYLGKIETINGTWKDGELSCVIPEIKRGMVVWCQE
jgi:hypothetical protein